ncbi:MAG: hypothetical protein LJE85_08270 [Gammaproteobacteria bacterium]|nr:hypothetical protein [Gammaproteobacteria bacterium]
MNAFELRRIVERALMPQGLQETAKHFLLRSERIKRAQYDVFDKLTMFGIVRHGKVNIEPDILAERVIERLNDSQYRDNVLVVREYVTRINNNDRRALSWRLKHWEGGERRMRDRRQPTVDLEKKQDEFA